MSYGKETSGLFVLSIHFSRENSFEIMKTLFRVNSINILSAYLKRLVAFAGQIGQCVHLPHCCVVGYVPGITSGIGAVADIYRRFAVVWNRRGTCKIIQ